MSVPQVKTTAQRTVTAATLLAAISALASMAIEMKDWVMCAQVSYVHYIHVCLSILIIIALLCKRKSTEVLNTRRSFITHALV